MIQNNAQKTAPNPESTQFGEKDVTPEQKTAAVRGVFDSVADNYDIMNDLMSGGIHRLWKDHLIRRIRPKAGLSYLDVAGGTGDIAFRIRQAIQKKEVLSARPPVYGHGDIKKKAQAGKPATPDSQNQVQSQRPRACAHDSIYKDAQAGKPATPDTNNTQITLCDLNWDMLRVGRDRAIDKGWLDEFGWITGNAETLPIPSNSVDVYTIAFGLRNVTRIDDALSEVFRVLKPGGRFYCLEFSHVDNPLLAKAYDAFSYNVIPQIGQAVAKDKDSYQYLVESIRKFPRQKDLQRRIMEAGLSHSKYENLTFGVACIHSAIKL